MTQEETTTSHGKKDEENIIDILLPYWGDASLLRQTIESVIKQTFSDWQLFIFDDCYPSDEAREYIANLNDRRIHYYRHPTNIGITKNFNFALNKATAKYCVMLGCDDKLLPTFIEKALFSIGDADFYQPGVEIIDDNDMVFLPLVDRIKWLLRPKKTGLYSGEKLVTTLCTGNWLYFPSIVWKTNVIKKYGFDTKHDDTQDVILELNILKDGAKLFLDNEVTFQYRRSNASWSSRRKLNGGGRFEQEKTVYNNFAKEFKHIKWHKAALAARIHATSRLHRLLTSLRLKSF